MASTLPTLCFDEIFGYLRGDTSSLYACALVNRNWGWHAIRELWRDPFIVVKSPNRREKLFNLLLLFLDDSNAKSLREPYLTYMRKLNFAELVKAGKIQNKISLRLIKALSRAIVSHSNNLQELDNDLIAPLFQNRLYIKRNTLIVPQFNFFKFPGANISFTNLKCLFIDNLNAYQILKSAVNIAPSLVEITIRLYCENYLDRRDTMTYKNEELLPTTSLTLLNSFLKLERFNIIEGPRTRWRALDADIFLCQVGHKLPTTVNHFGFDIDCEFSVVALNKFLSCTAHHIKTLSFARCTKFNKNHLKAIYQHKDLQIDALNIPWPGNFDKFTLYKAKKRITTVRFDSTGTNKFNDSDASDNEVYNTDDSYFRRNKRDYYNQAYDSSSDHDSSASYAERRSRYYYEEDNDSFFITSEKEIFGNDKYYECCNKSSSEEDEDR
ncbi:hypothetical protein RhiirA5_376852 [Rhizophagus irregularis]|uniref:F-box domain-containing protein n=1 Tax=Rhizophagus irregularis TaxID=588596 RepID=A0A2I1E0V4_9GLOM|nr:hypothetical protein RhiirA5_376852 [Rhizophagus irregularis]PKC74721.1 hypothetical protein RhiirA1_436741 [Rhizophagus irregularis]PKY15762.1 hypothetical protein RhiirB3_466929 [Rhizophagus irregularis]CAB4481085.1 unnamed protein product [Rhizophagus irregularis]CAB5202157.1 unnamed protein product [Rhizophagus irregularis]